MYKNVGLSRYLVTTVFMVFLFFALAIRSCHSPFLLFLLSLLCSPLQFPFSVLLVLLFLLMLFLRLAFIHDSLPPLRFELEKITLFLAWPRSTPGFDIVERALTFGIETNHCSAFVY